MVSNYRDYVFVSNHGDYGDYVFVSNHGDYGDYVFCLELRRPRGLRFRLRGWGWSYRSVFREEQSFFVEVGTVEVDKKAIGDA